MSQSTDPDRERAQTTLGAALMLLGVAVVPVMDAIAKALGESGQALGLGPALSPLQIAFARFTVQAALLAPAATLLIGLHAFRPREFGIVMLRGALIATATVAFFIALERMPLAEAIAIFFVEPLILTLLSAWTLGERVGWRRTVAVLVGFVGALVIIGPNFERVGWPALLPMLSAVCFAVYLLLTKRLIARGVPSIALQLWAGVFGAVALGLGLVAAALFGDGAPEWRWATPVAPEPIQLALLGVLGLAATISHLLIVGAFARAPASLLAPLQYGEIVAATALSYAVFGDALDGSAAIGVALIVLSGVFVLHRERIRRGPNPAAPTPIHDDV